MPPPKALPDPQWTEGPLECVGCGYSLAGLAVPGVCPECGSPFDAQVMVLHGVPRSSAGTPLWRRIVWIVLFTMTFILVQGLGFLVIISWVIPVVGLAAVLCGAAYMIATGPRERSGTERFMFTSAGVARLPAKHQPDATKLDAVLIPYSSAAKLRITSASNVWQRLRIEMPDERGVYQVVFDAGVRCPAHFVQHVKETIIAAMGQNSPAPPPLPLHPPTAPGGG